MIDKKLDLCVYFEKVFNQFRNYHSSNQVEITLEVNKLNLKQFLKR